MLINKKILECEMEYAKCFSEFYEDENIIRFRDNELRDMYNHNFTYIKGTMNEARLSNIIKDEVSLRLAEGSNFCNIFLNPDIYSWNLTELKYKPSVVIMGFYSFDISCFSRLKAISECIISRAVNQEMIDDILYCDLQHDEKRLGIDFCTRRCYRRGKVYLSGRGLNSYVCYHNGERIGTCDLFIHKGVAKIEDFGVIPRYQGKGYGTTILKSLLDTAIKEGCHTIYLGTDEDDTAKEMYLKNGFTKIGQKTELFFKL